MKEFKWSTGWTQVALLICMGLVLNLSGCGAGKTIVNTPPETHLHLSSVDIVQGVSTVAVPYTVSNELMDKLSEKIYEEGNFVKGNDLTITYRCIQYDPGDQFTRWFWGGIGNAGEGVITIETTFANATGKQLAMIQSEGKIGSGFFGGDFSLAIDKVAEEIVEYTKANFK